MGKSKDNTKGIPAIGSHHYRAFVGPAQKYDLMGAIQFNLLTYLGLRETDYLLDIGCGSLRAGRLFIPYLLPRRYCGIEPVMWLVEKGFVEELGGDIIDTKKPEFSDNDEFDLTVFGVDFDYILAQSIFTHATQTQIKDCFAGVGDTLKAGGLFVFSFLEGDGNATADSWSYPGCVPYTVAFMQQQAEKVGLEARVINWSHPNNVTWVVAARSESLARLINDKPELFMEANIKKEKTSTGRLRELPMAEKEVASRELRRQELEKLGFKDKKAYLVLGMHRSGTSFIAKALHDAGVDMGEGKLMGANEWNRLGHFENVQFVSMNSQIQIAAGAQDWSHIPTEDKIMKAGEERRDNIVETINKNKSAFWGWKDPRTVMTLPLYLRELEGDSDDVYLVCVFRKPKKVAESLERRGGTAILEGMKLAKKNNLMIIRWIKEFVGIE